MKKNTMMRVASALLVAVLLSTCAISGTFAKYTTTQTGSDSARVAKFGVTITANGSTFAEEYETDDNNVKSTIAKSVVNAGGVDDKNLVAPGTKGEMVKMVLAGTPEVAVNVKYEATLNMAGWEVDGATYCPIIFTVNGNDFYIGQTDIDDTDDLAAAVVAAINGYSKNYGPNQDLSKEADVATPDVSWRWEYEKDTLTFQNDENDTALGDEAATGTAATLELIVKTTITQID